MKIFALILLVIASILAANAKDYVPIIPNDTAFFTGSGGQILAVRVDSIKTYNNQNLYILNRTWDTEDFSCIKPTGPSWLGPHYIEESDSVYLFLNKNNDTIRIELLTQLYNSFRVFNYPNGDYIKATVSKIEFREFLELADTVKEFVLERKNTNGIIVSDDINGQTFSISKNYGFVKIFSMLEFPEIDSNFTLSGKTNPQSGKTFLTPNEIFDFEVGDEFHSIYHYSEAYWGFIYHETISKVIDKKFSTNNDTIIYTFSDKIHLNQKTPEDPEEIDISYVQTKDNSYVINEFYYLPLEPIHGENRYEAIYGFSFGYHETDVNNKRCLITSADEFYKFSDTCWENVIYDPLCYISYLEGCGKFVEIHYPFGDVLNDSYKLVYYKKADETWWGEPLVISVEDNKSFGSFNYFPNPAKRDEIITIRNKIPISKIKIIDILGNEQINSNIDYQNEIKLKLNNFESGLYFIILFDTGNNIISDKLIVE